MSFVETSMFAPRIWGFDTTDAEMRQARAAGWSRADLVWERLIEAAGEALIQGNSTRAARLIRSAGWLARLRFARDDLRRATSEANLALLAQAAGHTARATRHQTRALTLWQAADTAIDQIEFRPRSRSSLFHLRMEALHRDTFQNNLRNRYRAIARETETTLRTLSQPAERPLYLRWRGEKPPVHDDSRKFLAAALLILNRPENTN